jgi:hypothetical protein
LTYLQEEEEGDAVIVDSPADFDFMKNWPVDDKPDVSFLMQQGASRDDVKKFLDGQPHVSHIYKTKENYASFVSKCMLPCVGQAKHRAFITGAKSLEDSFTVEDEALCILVLVNSYRKWKDEARWRLESLENRNATKLPEEVMKTLSKALYTESNTEDEGKRNTRQGWSHEGQVAFVLIKRSVDLKRKSFPNIEEYKTYVTEKMCNKGKRRVSRDVALEEPATKQYKAFLALADDLNGCIV